MDRAAAAKRSNTNSLQRLRRAAWRGLTETLEKRMMLSASPTINQQALFIENAGQWNDPAIKFALQTTAGSIVMTDHGPVFNTFRQTTGSLKHDQFSVHFDGASDVDPTGSDAGGVFNYPHAGVTGVNSYKSVTYSDLYNGINLQTYGQRDNLKYEFHVAPGADATQVQISYDGIQGLSIDSKGRLHIQTKLGQLVDDAPVVYQTINGKRVVIESAFRLIDSNTYAFDVNGSYDPSKELVLDPSINWGTYFGGAAADTGDSVAIDDNGNVYIGGSTNSTDFPLLNAIDAAKDGTATDGYVSKFDVNGNLVWSTYIGGNQVDAVRGIKLTADGSHVYVAGTTSSSDVGFLPVNGANWTSGPQYGGGGDAFVASLGSNGSFSFAGYFGGNAADTVNGVAIDSEDNFYITGATTSTNLDLFGGFGTDQTGNDAYVAKFDLSITARNLLWTAQIGGNADDVGQAIDVVGDHVYLVGDSTSTTLDPVIAGVDIGLAKDANRDAFVMSISGANSQAAPEWFRFLGGDGNDTGGGIAVNANGKIAVTGNTASDTTFPLTATGREDTVLGGANDAYIAIYGADGAEEFISYVGGAQADTGNAMLLDQDGNFLLIGTSASNDIGFVNDAGGQFRNNGANDAMYGIFSENGTKLALDEYGGNQADTGLDGAINSDGGLYIVGTTSSTNLAQGQPASGVNEVAVAPRTNRGAGDAYVVFIALTPLAAAPTAPVNLRATAQSNGAIRLDWGDTSQINDGFHIYRSTSKTARLSQYLLVGTVGGSTTTYVDTAVESGTTYYYIVTAFRGALERASNRASALTINSAVKAPSGLAATAVSSSEIDLKWVDTSSNESEFEVWRQETLVGDWILIGTTQANDSDYKDTTVAPDTEYAYRVRAKNSLRVSPFTDPKIVRSKGSTFIVAPTSLNATRTGETSIILSWQDNSQNNTAFTLERADFGTTDFEVISSSIGQNATSFTDNTVEVGRIYLYRIKATNGGLSSAYSNIATSDVSAALLKPTRFEALSNASNQIKLTWRDNAQIESGFVIERAQNEPNDWTPIGTAPANATSFYDKHVQSGKRYYYRIRATDGTNFSSYSAQATDRVLQKFVTAPRMPTDLRGKLLTNTSIRMVWRDNAIDESSYWIERSTSLDGGFQKIGETDVNVNVFTDKTMLANKTYYYRVRAVSGGIRSSPSNILKVKASLTASAKTKAASVSVAQQSPPPTASVFSTRKVHGDESVLSTL